MTVYFVSPIEDSGIVKIVFTADIDRRLSNLASEVDGGVVLVAFCDGDEATERAFHRIFADDWVEGEWYRRTPFMDRVIETLRPGEDARKVWGRLRSVEAMPLSPIERDKIEAKQKIEEYLTLLGSMPIGVGLSRTFDALRDLNPAWSRRRVRALWAKEAARVDLYEFRDLEANIAAFHSPEIGAVRGAMGGVDRPGTERD